MLAVVATGVRAVTEGPHVLVRYLVVVAVMSLLHCAFGLVRTRDTRFLLFAVYGFLHAALLIPVRMKALFTLTNSAWGTRTGTARAAVPAELPAPSR